ncbi:MAG TPA: hypothetical protein VHQ02_14815 [Usitatibacter sp.]|nr:hypothetical protein [Usitatibacter sp.]
MLEVPEPGCCVVSVEELEGAELVPDVPEVDWSDDEPVLALVVPLEPDDWLVLEPCDIDEDELMSVDCWLALVGPLVTLCEPLPTFTPGLMFAPAFTSELLTPTFASTPTFGLTFSVLPALPDDVELLGEELLLGVVLLELVLGVVLDELLLGLIDDEELEAPGVLEDWLAFRLVELDELLGEAGEPFRFRLFELEELLEGAVAEPFTFTSVELEELLGAEAAPFTLMSVELDELLGVDALPFRLMELDDELGVVPLIVVEDDEDPGTTAMPGVVSVVIVLLLDPVSGALGMQPAGWVFAVSMHFGSRRSLLPLVMVSARATPKAASSEAARRLILKVLCVMSFLPFWTRSG